MTRLEEIDKQLSELYQKRFALMYSSSKTSSDSGYSPEYTKTVNEIKELLHERKEITDNIRRRAESELQPIENFPDGRIKINPSSVYMVMYGDPSEIISNIDQLRRIQKSIVETCMDTTYDFSELYPKIIPVPQSKHGKYTTDACELKEEIQSKTNIDSRRFLVERLKSLYWYKKITKVQYRTIRGQIRKDRHSSMNFLRKYYPDIEDGLKQYMETTNHVLVGTINVKFNEPVKMAKVDITIGRNDLS